MTYQYKYHGKNKYRNTKTEVDGIKFDSLKEARRWKTLRLLEETGEIVGLQRQVKFVLIPSQKDPETGKVIEREASYVADFVYVDRFTDQTIVEDAKGYKTPEYILKRKMMLWRYGIQIKET